MSNRDVQPLKFSCKKCESQIGIRVVNKDGMGLDGKITAAMMAGKTSISHLYENNGLSYKISGAVEIPLEGMFDPALDFVDLHLDFPVVFGKYVMGNTPFMQAVGRSSGEEAAFHRDRLEIINRQYSKYPQVVELISKYTKGLVNPFIAYADKHFKVDVKSKKQEDINAALYTVVSRYTGPFLLVGDTQSLVDKYTKTVINLVTTKKTAMAEFMQELFDTKFLANLQRDCLKIYKPIFNAELPLRPALFLDVDSTYGTGKAAMRVSSQDFEEYREVYKDMAEVLSRQLVLVAGMGNLIERGDHNAFSVRTSKSGKQLSPSSLNEYADVALGNKLQDLDSTWHTIDEISHDNELRNAIAHNKIDYDDITQCITYYPKIEGMGREKKREIYLLDYMHRLLALFRDVHRLHHLVKCLNYAMLIEPSASLVKR
jgi:hypothetical protein